MDEIQQTIQKILELSGFTNFQVQGDNEHRRISILLDEGDWFKKFLPNFVSSIDHIVKLITKKHEQESVYVDINNYRLEREKLIVELAKAAARKALITKGDIELPAMNGYERRLIHMELATRPDVKTESIGEGKERRVLVKPI